MRRRRGARAGVYRRGPPGAVWDEEDGDKPTYLTVPLAAQRAGSCDEEVLPSSTGRGRDVRYPSTNESSMHVPLLIDA